MTDHIDIVFDGPPAHESGRFIEVEDEQHKSINVGEWIQRPADGYWVLRLDTVTIGEARVIQIRKDGLVRQFDNATRVWGVRHKRTLVSSIRADRLDAENSVRLNPDLEVVSHWQTRWETPQPGDLS